MDDDLLDVARTIRPYLQVLIAEEAASVDREIARLLAAAQSGQDVEDDLEEVLAGSPALYIWMEEVLADELHRPPELQPADVRRSSRGSQPPPGNGDPVDAEKYICPVDGNYIWWRQLPSDNVGTCRDHGCPLVPA
jgi:hypothetical protein